MDLIKETKVIPSLVNPNNFKIKKIKPANPVESFKKNSHTLNTIMLVGFIIFFTFFLLNCKYGIFKCPTNEPEGYSVAYNLNSV